MRHVAEDGEDGEASVDTGAFTHKRQDDGVPAHHKVNKPSITLWLEENGVDRRKRRKQNKTEATAEGNTDKT